MCENIYRVIFSHENYKLLFIQTIKSVYMYKIFQIIKNPLNIKQVNTVLSTVDILYLSQNIFFLSGAQRNILFSGKVIGVFIIKEINILEL